MELNNEIGYIMENQSKKCSYKEHEEINANVYCGECKVFMCK